MKKLICLLIILLVSASEARAVSGTAARPLRIGLITDGSGVFADLDGPAGADAIRMAVDDFGGTVLGRPIQVEYFDHQNRADMAAMKAREWFDRGGVQLLIGGTNSAANLAMSRVSREKRRLMISVGGATSALTSEQCSPYLIQWAHNTHALAKGTAQASMRAGAKRWFFLQADYAFGEALRADAAEVIKQLGGSIVGTARHPLGTSDFSSYVLQAASTQADVLALASAGQDAQRAIHAAKEFGVIPRLKLAGLLMFVTDIHALGLDTTQGLVLTDSWYWSRDAQSRAWAERFFKRWNRMPTSLQAANYSATWQYLQAVRKVKTDEADAVIASLRSQRMKDMFLTSAWLRQDGTLVHDMYLLRVKTPAQSLGGWDYYEPVGVMQGEAAWMTKAESRCPLWTEAGRR